MPRGFKVADAYVELTIDKDELRRGAAGIPAAVGPEMDRAGRDMGKRLGKSLGDESKNQGDDAGGKLALGMRMSIIRNSPLIVAAVGAALAVGGPAMMTAAVGLFAGIGIVAAAQSDKVQQAWVGTWNTIKDATIASAADIEPVLVKMAGAVGASFERMQPQIANAFSAAAPQIEVFTRGLTDLAENAMPGLVRAVEQGMPVTQGFADFLAKVGTGLSDFFDRISAHGPAAGQVWSSLGDIMGKLLPILGELLGQGAELASMVLPLLSSSLGLVLNVLTALGPALPVVAAGFGAFKIVSALSGPMASFSTSLGNLAAKGIPGLSAAAGVAGSAVGALGTVLPVVGVAFAVVTAAIANNEQRINSWASALVEGGAAAAAARQEMDEAPGAWDRFSFAITHAGNSMGVVGKQSAEARQAMDDMLASMDPVARTSTLLTQAEHDLSFAIEEHGASSNEASGKQNLYDAALRKSQEAAASLEQAIHGVTQAMIDQANQAMGAINADFAYQDALDGLEDKQRAVAEAIRDHGKASEEASDASRAYAEGIWDTAQKAAAANPMLDGLTEGTKEYDRAVQNLTLKALVDMRAGLGPGMQAAVDGMIAQLQRGGASLDELGEKKPKPVVDAEIGPLQDKVSIADGALAMLDGKRPLPGLDLNTGPFNGKTETSFGLLDVLDGKRPLPVADLNPAPLNGNTQASINWLEVLGGKRPTPVADLNPAPLNGQTQGALNLLGILGGQRPTPVATLIDNASGTARAIANLIGQIQSKTVTITTIHRAVTQAATAVAGAFPGFASGGNIGAGVRRFDGGGTPSRRSDGRLSGPGGPLDDLIPAMTNMGELIRVANSEWVVPGSVASRQGDRRMAALTAGQADIVPRRFDRGGSVDERDRPGMGRSGDVHIHIEGTFDLASSRDLDRAANVLHAKFKQIERSLS